MGIGYIKTQINNPKCNEIGFKIFWRFDIRLLMTFIRVKILCDIYLVRKVVEKEQNDFFFCYQTSDELSSTGSQHVDRLRLHQGSGPLRRWTKLEEILDQKFPNEKRPSLQELERNAGLALQVGVWENLLNSPSSQKCKFERVYPSKFLKKWLLTFLILRIQRSIFLIYLILHLPHTP